MPLDPKCTMGIKENKIWDGYNTVIYLEVWSRAQKMT